MFHTFWYGRAFLVDQAQAALVHVSAPAAHPLHASPTYICTILTHFQRILGTPSPHTRLRLRNPPHILHTSPSAQVEKPQWHLRPASLLEPLPYVLKEHCLPYFTKRRVFCLQKSQTPLTPRVPLFKQGPCMGHAPTASS